MATIVIIEDDYNLADIICRYLSYNQHQVFVAYNAYAGIRLSRRWQPDLVILNLFLPDMYGEEVAMVLKRQLGLAANNTKLVLLSDKLELASTKAPFVFDLMVSKPVNLLEFSNFLDWLLCKDLS
jgi:DNA-binding response OmpR family regulator